MHESIKNRSIVVKIQFAFPIGDAWSYGPHVTKVDVSYGNMDDVRHANSTHGGGACSQSARFPSDLHGHGPSKCENSKEPQWILTP